MLLAADEPLADNVLLAGLLHNIGYWILLQECPAELRQAVDIATTERIPLHVAERRLFGTSHAEVGAYLLGLWGLPHEVVEAIAFQHRPQDAFQTQFDVLAVLIVAQCLTESGKDVAQPLEHGGVRVGDDYLNSLAAPFDWDEARLRVGNSCRGTPQ